MPEDLDMRDAVAGFLKANPAPSDADFHTWAESQGFDKHEAEQMAYVLAAEKVEGESQNDVIPGGKASGRPDSDFAPAQLAKGRRIEKEHTPDPRFQTEISKDHLAETQPEEKKGEPPYYDRSQMAKELAKGAAYVLLKSFVKPAEQFGPVSSAVEGPSLGKRAFGMSRPRIDHTAKPKREGAIPQELLAMLGKQAVLPVSPTKPMPNARPAAPSIPETSVPVASPAPLRQADHAYPPLQKLTGAVNERPKGASYDIGVIFGQGLDKEAQPKPVSIGGYDVNPSLLYGLLGAGAGGGLGYLLGDEDKLKSSILGALTGGALGGGGHWLMTQGPLADKPEQSSPPSTLVPSSQPSAVNPLLRLLGVPAAATALTEAGARIAATPKAGRTRGTSWIPAIKATKPGGADIRALAEQLLKGNTDKATLLGLTSHGKLPSTLKSYPAEMQADIMSKWRAGRPFAERFVHPAGRLGSAGRTGKTFIGMLAASQLADWLSRSQGLAGAWSGAPELNQPGG